MKPLNGQVQHQLFMRLSVQDEEAGQNCPFTTFNQSYAACCNSPQQTPEKDVKIDEKTNTDCVSGAKGG